MFRRGWAVDPDVAQREALRDEVERLLGHILRPRIMQAIADALGEHTRDQVQDAMARHMPRLVKDWAQGLTEDALRDLIRPMVANLIRLEVERIRRDGI